MKDRKIELEYKGIKITGYKGSNWAYIGNRPFTSFLSAKRHITKLLNHLDNVDDVKRFYGLTESVK